MSKHFKLVKGAELIFYGLNTVDFTKDLFLVEGECFHPSAEILTPNGWVSFENYKNEKVAQYNEDGTIFFIKPLAKIKKEYNGTLCEHSNKQKFYSLTTPNHNMIVGNRSNGKLVKIKANELPSNGLIPRVALHDGNGINLSDLQIRLCIAVSADFTIRKGGDLYGCFKKERKKIRFCEILEELKIKYSCRKDKRNYWSIFVRRGDVPKYLFKLFPHTWINESSISQKKLIIDEILFWDGNSVPLRKQIEYSSKEILNATFIQTIASLVGYCSTIIPRKNDFGSWYKVSILFSKTHTSAQNLAKTKKEINYNGFVYCVTVPSGMLIVRQNNCISISGNCDALTLWQSGFKNVMSVPNGANLSKNNVSYFDSVAEHFENIPKVYLCFDNDNAGRKLRDEFAERIGKDKCVFVEFKDCKDANDCLQKYDLQSIIESVSEAKEFPLEGCYTISDMSDEIDDMYNNGLEKPLVIGMPNFDKHIGFVKGYITTITGVPSHGKSDFLDEIILRMYLHHGWKTAYYSPENKPTKLHFSKLARKITGKAWDGYQRINLTELNYMKNLLNKEFWWIKPEKDFTLETILNSAKSLKLKYGISSFVIDAWNKLEHKYGASETKYIGESLDLISKFCENHNVHCFLVAHPTKMRKQKDNIGKIEVPNLYDISGSANFYNKTDNGLCVYRDFEENRTYIYIQKVKFSHWGETGFSKFEYELKSGRYLEEGSPQFLDSWINFKQSTIEENKEFLNDIVAQPNTDF